MSFAACSQRPPTALRQPHGTVRGLAPHDMLSPSCFLKSSLQGAKKQDSCLYIFRTCFQSLTPADALSCTHHRRAVRKTRVAQGGESLWEDESHKLSPCFNRLSDVAFLFLSYIQTISMKHNLPLFPNNKYSYM